MIYIVEKRAIINFLFVLSFPVYGIGIYIGATSTPTLGYIITSLPYVIIILFYMIDIIYKREFKLRINGYYLVILLYLLSVITSLFVSMFRGLPESDMNMLIIRSILILAPFHAFLIVYLYNLGYDVIARLTLKGLGILLLINLFGYYVLGMANEVHSIEGRINFPFLDGLYSGACLIAIINLMLFYSFKNILAKPITAIFAIAYFIVNLFFFFYINSRLVTLVMLLVILLMVLNVRKKFTGVFALSVFTLPLLLSGGLLIYEILSLPFFSAILQRVDLYDVVTFHGRSFLWQNGMDWLLEDQRGLLFGNGYKGHYFIDLFGNVIKLFDLKEVHHLHAHSTTLEIVVAQGLFGLILFMAGLYKAFIFYRKNYQNGSADGTFFPVMIFMIFISHVDGFAYMDSFGGMLFAFLVSKTCMRPFELPVLTDFEKTSPEMSPASCNPLAV